MIRPIIATRAVAWLKSIELKPMIVPFAEVTIPALLSPIRAMKSPIPTATAFFIVPGIELIIASRTPKNESKIKRTPSIKTAVRANQGEHPIWPQTV